MKNEVLLAKEPDRSVRDVGENPGTKVDLLYRWRRQFRDNGEIAFPGHGKIALNHEENGIRELEKKLKDAEMKQDILKKAMAIFSRSSK